jgi:hypothetical protein
MILVDGTMFWLYRLTPQSAMEAARLHYLAGALSNPTGLPSKPEHALLNRPAGSGQPGPTPGFRW